MFSSHLKSLISSFILFQNGDMLDKFIWKQKDKRFTETVSIANPLLITEKNNSKIIMKTQSRIDPFSWARDRAFRLA